MKLINNQMFDDGSFECHTFSLADKDEAYTVSFDHELVSKMRPRIELAMAFGKNHLNIREDRIFIDGLQIFEIQWD